MKGKKYVTLQDLKRLAKSQSTAVDSYYAKKDYQTLAFEWIAEYQIMVGVNKIYATPIYEEFVKWCKDKRVTNIPSISVFAKSFKKVIQSRVVRGKTVYYINYTLEELKALRETKEKKEARDTKKEVKEIEAQES